VPSLWLVVCCLRLGSCGALFSLPSSYSELQTTSNKSQPQTKPGGFCCIPLKYRRFESPGRSGTSSVPVRRSRGFWFAKPLFFNGGIHKIFDCWIADCRLLRKGTIKAWAFGVGSEGVRAETELVRKETIKLPIADCRLPISGERDHKSLFVPIPEAVSPRTCLFIAAVLCTNCRCARQRNVCCFNRNLRSSFRLDLEFLGFGFDDSPD